MVFVLEGAGGICKCVLSPPPEINPMHHSWYSIYIKILYESIDYDLYSYIVSNYYIVDDNK